MADEAELMQFREADAIVPRRAMALAPAVADADQIIRDFKDPHLELIRLLKEASEIEHTLLVQYLYAVFSLKPKYDLVAGSFFRNSNDLSGVTVEEMKHLNQVNQLLVIVGGSPNLLRQDFPYEPDIYPFELNLEPLSPKTLAKYVYVEAPSTALDRMDPVNIGDPVQLDFLARLYQTLDEGTRPNHLGSLYAAIIKLVEEFNPTRPAEIPDLTPWIARLKRIKDEGEEGHFKFFKRVFLGTHEGFEGKPQVWGLDPSHEDYPVFALPTNPSAYEGHPNQILGSADRDLAWLSNLHYWIILILLDLFYRFNRPIYLTLSRNHMTGPLVILGNHLAPRGVGIPFDPLSMGYAPGVTEAATLRVLRMLLTEAEDWTASLRGDLPDTYPFGSIADTLSSLPTGNS
ncbi:ferritin-like domain-containing protein [Tundrisphaera sp. TA3]|uniref:ferritin-like domain-containing protein n=1 Tax=Tundrisphaera sp. TA3 TaxID=3435775 RepID=UPI003EBDA074